MNATKQFIEDAVKGGWNIPTRIEEGASSFFVSENGGERREVLMIQGIFLDPDVWQAVGKARGWVDKDYPDGQMRCSSKKCDDRYCSYAGYKNPVYFMHGLIDALAEGKSIEAYLSSIE